MEFIDFVDRILAFIVPHGSMEVAPKQLGDSVGDFLRNLFENPTSYIPSTGTVKALVFALFGIWLFSFLIWDFILTMFKQYEFLRIGKSNVFNFKREIQTFLLMIGFVGWSYYYLYSLFEDPGLGSWFVAGGAILLAGWANRSLSTRWMVAVWEPLDAKQRKTMQQDPFLSEAD